MNLNICWRMLFLGGVFTFRGKQAIVHPVEQIRPCTRKPKPRGSDLQ